MGQTLFKMDKFMDVSLNVNGDGDGDVYCSTLRVSICEMLVSNGKCCKCCKCVSYRPTLRKMYSRWRKSTDCESTKAARTTLGT